jgi:hypothetical protein
VPRRPRHIWCDQGSEFYNKYWTARITPLGIKRYSSFGTHKAAIVERFNRTLKSWTWRLFTEHQDRKWTPYVQELVVRYNTRVHRALGVTPAAASDPRLEPALWRHQYGDQFDSKPVARPKFSVGQWVRISRIKGMFEKGYHPNWSAEVYKVRSRLQTRPIMYELSDYFGEPIDGAFYESELQATTTPDVMLIEEVLGRRKVGRKEQIKVKWFGYPVSKARWIDASDVVQKF